MISGKQYKNREKFNKEIENIQGTKQKILQQKNKMTEELNSVNSRLDQTEESVS